MTPTVSLKSIGHYRIDAVLGEGGMGVVYRAHDTHLRRPVAVKVLVSERLNAATRGALREEALVLSSLNHPNIATLFDFGSENGVDYLVMELVPGQTIYDRLRAAPFCELEIITIGAQLLRGLAAAHAAGVIHRDIKPRNLCVTPQGLLKILDFGIAISPAGETTTQTMWNYERRLTPMAGTLRYMAPERLEGVAADARSDIFSAGMVLYEMACGPLPPGDGYPPRLVGRTLRRYFWRQRIIPEVSRGLERVALRALEFGPDRRYQRALDVATDLEMLALSQNRSMQSPVVARDVVRLVGRLATTL